MGYWQNKMFLSDWDEGTFDGLDFYDIFDSFYPVLYKQLNPYTVDERSGVGVVDQIAEHEFENVIMSYMNIDKETLRTKTIYSPEEGTYEYRPWGLYEAAYSEVPYPEVIDCTENNDGTITLTVDGVWADYNSDQAFVNTIVVQPFEDGTFRYLSNVIADGEMEVPR